MLPCTVSAAETTVSIASETQFDDNGLPIAYDTQTLKTADWDGKAMLRENTCYFVEKSITLSKNVSLPESSMLVIRNRGKLTIADGGKLLANGTIALHYYGKIHVQSGGSLVLKSKSISVMYGKLAVSSGGYAGIYGYALCNGAVNIKGKLSIFDSGTLLTNNLNAYSSAVVKGEATKLEGVHPYMIQALEDAQKYDIKLTDSKSGSSAAVTSAADKKKLVRSFESVLYKYNGDIVLPAETTADEYRTDLCTWLSADVPAAGTHFGITSWNGFPLIPGAGYDDDLTGSYYSIVKGKPDEALCESFLSPAE